MTKIQQFNFVCRSILQIAFFYALMLWWGYQVDPLVLELYVNTPFVLFACTVFFLFLFFCRTMGCLVFMPKDKLKAILRDGQISPTASQIVIRLFSWPFIKRTALFFLLFVAEFALRLFFIPLFLKAVSLTIPLWAWLSSFSIILTNTLLIATAYIIMELPFYLLFYKLSFKGHVNRSYEYRFGMKLAAFVSILLGLRMALMSLETHFSFKGSELVSAGALAVSGIGLWYLMYRKDWSFCCNGCPFCSKIKSLFGKTCCCRQEKEQAELQESYETAEKVAETIIEAEAREITPPANENKEEEKKE